jgi:hypothetical protein
MMMMVMVMMVMIMRIMMIMMIMMMIMTVVSVEQRPGCANLFKMKRKIVGYSFQHVVL